MRGKLALITIAALSIAGVVGTAPLAAASPDVDCIQNPTANGNVTQGHFTGTNVNIRTGPFTTCTAVGEGQPGHNITEHCHKINSNGVTWVYLTDHTISRTGWSRDAFLNLDPIATC